MFYFRKANIDILKDTMYFPGLQPSIHSHAFCEILKEWPTYPTDIHVSVLIVSTEHTRILVLKRRLPGDETHGS